MGKQKIVKLSRAKFGQIDGWMEEKKEICLVHYYDNYHYDSYLFTNNIIIQVFFYGTVLFLSFSG